MKMKVFFALAIGLLMAFSVMAKSDTVSFDYKTVGEFMSAIPSLNDQLATNPLKVPGSVGFLIGGGDLLVEITMNDNSTKDFYVTSESKLITGIYEGKPEKAAYTVYTDEDTANGILASDDKLGSLISGYHSNSLQLKAKGIGNSIKLFFAKIFLKFA